MSGASDIPGRLSLWRAAFVIARRDFFAILMSKTFIFFLLGPLFPFVIGGLAGGIGSEVRDQVDRPTLGVALSVQESAAFAAAHRRLQGELGEYLPELRRLDLSDDDPGFDPQALLAASDANMGALVAGTLEAPTLYGSDSQVDAWQGRVSLIAREARSSTIAAAPPVVLAPTGSATTADQTRSRLFTAQAGQLLLFMLTMLLAGMVLSNLVEEKANKIIEILAAAIPMDAVFLGKLFAMLAISFVGITCWGLVIGGGLYASGRSLSELADPAVGWPAFLALGVIYFAMGYLLLGSLFLAIGSLATTVREVQTLSMPVTMLQLFVFLFASYAMAQPGEAIEYAAILFPFSSPFAMLARGAQDAQLWPHLAAIAYQAGWVAVFIKVGAGLFRRRVMKSGPQGATKRRFGFGRKVAA